MTTATRDKYGEDGAAAAACGCPPPPHRDQLTPLCWLDHSVKTYSSSYCSGSDGEGALPPPCCVFMPNLARF